MGQRHSAEAASTTYSKVVKPRKRTKDQGEKTRFSEIVHLKQLSKHTREEQHAQQLENSGKQHTQPGKEAKNGQQKYEYQDERGEDTQGSTQEQQLQKQLQQQQQLQQKLRQEQQKQHQDQERLRHSQQAEQQQPEALKLQGWESSDYYFTDLFLCGIGRRYVRANSPKLLIYSGKTLPVTITLFIIVTPLWMTSTKLRNDDPENRVYLTLAVFGGTLAGILFLICVGALFVIFVIFKRVIYVPVSETTLNQYKEASMHSKSPAVNGNQTTTDLDGEGTAKDRYSENGKRRSTSQSQGDKTAFKNHRKSSMSSEAPAANVKQTPTKPDGEGTEQERYKGHGKRRSTGQSKGGKPAPQNHRKSSMRSEVPAVNGKQTPNSDSVQERYRETGNARRSTYTHGGTAPKRHDKKSSIKNEPPVGGDKGRLRTSRGETLATETYVKSPAPSSYSSDNNNGKSRDPDSETPI